MEGGVERHGRAFRGMSWRLGRTTGGLRRNSDRAQALGVFQTDWLELTGQLFAYTPACPTLTFRGSVYIGSDNQRSRPSFGPHTAATIRTNVLLRPVLSPLFSLSHSPFFFYFFVFPSSPLSDSFLTLLPPLFSSVFVVFFFSSTFSLLLGLSAFDKGFLFVQFCLSLLSMFFFLLSYFSRCVLSVFANLSQTFFALLRLRVPSLFLSPPFSFTSTCLIVYFHFFF